ncbi:uncharacterized protein LOC128457392 [Pleuronectes platessa]|uniref:uncharacterized protein LOC128457392 n=1 Tax=Pleuronectes platessa TaxID=8262 RepID=UPI00232A5E99|nr:uncharacterized protein LOC128457392 [Pleuronectes platessa]
MAPTLPSPALTRFAVHTSCLKGGGGGAQFDYEGITACSGDYSAAPASELLGGSRHTRHTRSDTLFAVCREILPPSDVSYSLFNSASPLTRRRNTEGKSEVPAAGKLLAHPHWSWSGSFPVLSGADFREGPAPEPDMQSAGLQADHVCRSRDLLCAGRFTCRRSGVRLQLHSVLLAASLTFDPSLSKKHRFSTSCFVERGESPVPQEE